MFETEDTSCQRHQDASGKVRLFWGKNEPQTSIGSMLAGAETIHPLLQFSIVYFLYEDLNHWLYFKNSLYLNTSHLVTLFFVIFAANWLFYKFKMDYVIYKRPPNPAREENRFRDSQITLVGFRPTSLSVRKCCLQQQSSGIHCLWGTELVRKQVFLQMCVSGRDLSASTLTVQHRGIMQTSSGVGLHRVNWWERLHVGFCANLAANTVMERASLSGENSTVRALETRFPLWMWLLKSWNDKWSESEAKQKKVTSRMLRLQFKKRPPVHCLHLFTWPVKRRVPCVYLLECRVSKTKLFLYFINPTFATRRANTSVKIVYIGLKKQVTTSASFRVKIKHFIWCLI